MKRQISINLDEQTHKDLDKLAKRRRCSKNQVIVQLITSAAELEFPAQGILKRFAEV